MGIRVHLFFRPRKTTAVNVSFQQNNAIGSGSEAAEPQSAGGAAAVSTGGLTVTLSPPMGSDDSR